MCFQDLYLVVEVPLSHRLASLLDVHAHNFPPQNTTTSTLAHVCRHVLFVSLTFTTWTAQWTRTLPIAHHHVREAHFTFASSARVQVKTCNYVVKIENAGLCVRAPTFVTSNSRQSEEHNLAILQSRFTGYAPTCTLSTDGGNTLDWIWMWKRCRFLPRWHPPLRLYSLYITVCDVAAHPVWPPAVGITQFSQVVGVR